RQADRALPDLRDQPDPDPRRHLPRGDLPDAAARDGLPRHLAGLPAGRCVRADHHLRGPGHREADRRQAPAAPLRRDSSVTPPDSAHYPGPTRIGYGALSRRLLIVGLPGAGKANQAERIAELLGIPAISIGDICHANVYQESELRVLAKSYKDKGV